MKNIKLFEDFINESKQYTGQEVADHIINITPEESDIPDFFINEYILPNNNWELKRIKLSDILKDKDFKEYFNSGEERYNEKDMYYDDMFEPIVFYKGQLLDGYSRVSRLIRMGKKYCEGFILK